jgi:hypothetical protein
MIEKYLASISECSPLDSAPPREYKHWPQVEDSQRVNRLVHEFLNVRS